MLNRSRYGYKKSSARTIPYSGESVLFSTGHSDKMDSGLAVATVSSIGYLGFLIGPPLIGHISHAISLHYTFAVIACVGVIVAVAATRLPIHKQ